METAFFCIPLSRLEPVIKRWVREVYAEFVPTVTPTHQPDDLLTIQQAAEFLRLSVPTVYAQVSRGELPVMKRNKRLYFSRTELMDYLKDGRKKTVAEFEAESEAYLSNRKKGLNHGK
jgi:excisionase family DNA binding protein